MERAAQKWAAFSVGGWVARTGGGGGVWLGKKGRKNDAAPRVLVRTTRNMLEYMMHAIDSKSAEGNLLRVQVSLPVPR